MCVYIYTHTICVPYIFGYVNDVEKFTICVKNCNNRVALFIKCTDCECHIKTMFTDDLFLFFSL